jgi:hypothetical protein
MVPAFDEDPVGAVRTNYRYSASALLLYGLNGPQINIIYLSDIKCRRCKLGGQE